MRCRASSRATSSARAASAGRGVGRPSDAGQQRHPRVQPPPAARRAAPATHRHDLSSDPERHRVTTATPIPARRFTTVDGSDEKTMARNMRETMLALVFLPEAPNLALHREGHIALRYPGGRHCVLMTASWPAGQAGESGRVHRTALLEPAEHGLDTGAEFGAGATPLPNSMPITGVAAQARPALRARSPVGPGRRRAARRQSTSGRRTPRVQPTPRCAPPGLPSLRHHPPWP